MWTDLSTVLSQFTRVTDGQTDGQTDRILITIPRLHYMQRGKNHYLFWTTNAAASTTTTTTTNTALNILTILTMGTAKYPEDNVNLQRKDLSNNSRGYVDDFRMLSLLTTSNQFVN